MQRTLFLCRLSMMRLCVAFSACRFFFNHSSRRPCGCLADRCFLHQRQRRSGQSQFKFSTPDTEECTEGLPSGFSFWASKTLFFLTRQKENGVWVRTCSLYCKSFLLPLKKRCGASAPRGRGKRQDPFLLSAPKEKFLGLQKKRRLEAPPEVPTNLSGAQTLNCLRVMRRCR